MPALPGAQRTRSARPFVVRASVRQSACSRPPEPMTSTFMGGKISVVLYFYVWRKSPAMLSRAGGAVKRRVETFSSLLTHIRDNCTVQSHRRAVSAVV